MTFPSGTSFALVRSIDMSINLSNRFDTFETRDQLGKVLLYFKGLVPNTQNIAFSNYDTDAFGPSEGFNEELRNTVFGFIKGIREVSVWGLRTAEFLDHINPADFVNLVRFDFICHGESTAFNTIVRNNAKTLRSLHADYEFDTRISSILYDEDGNTMVYPCLESLNIWGDRQDDRTPIEDQQLHFPAIKDFCVWVCDSLCYDVFFNNQNSNFRSLRSLEMVNVPEFIDNAHESYAISTKQLVNLWKLSFEIKLFLDDSHYSNPGEADQANIRFIRMLSRIPNALGYLRISGVIAEGPFMDLMTSGCGFESLQDIVLPNISLGLGNIFELMKTAPLLCSISAHTKEEYPSIQNVASEDLAQNVKTNFRSLGRHITHISLHTRNGSDNLSNYCMTVALLVIACPRLASIVNYGLGKQELKTSLLELRNNEDFVEYGDRFKLLAGNIDN
ncbi:hypothetical protein IWW45_003970 [Coemansia sp. RSA 485]|nr:hypothetical protein IWW45_003970 [Coemansia sp. RSA 485]